MLASDRIRARRLGVRPARPTSRWWAVATAAAFVLSSLLGLLHEATTKHVRCAQHGELIDDGLAASSPRPAPPMASAPALCASVPGGQAAAPHGHEHCTLISATRQSRVMPRPPAVIAAPLAIADRTAAPPQVDRAPGRILYRTAPKTSPPA